MVPSVAVRQCGAVCNACDLVPIVPPGHDASVLRRVLPQPDIPEQVRQYVTC